MGCVDMKPTDEKIALRAVVPETLVQARDKIVEELGVDLLGHGITIFNRLRIRQRDMIGRLATTTAEQALTAKKLNKRKYRKCMDRRK